MTTKLNLAAKPFSNRFLPWAFSVVTIFVALVALVLIIRATGSANAQSQVVQNDIRKLDQQVQGLKKQNEEVKNSLTFEQQQTLNATHLLVDRKRFSWSRLLADLESALPENVRVTRISVRDVATRGEETIAELDLTVVSKASSTVTDMMADMEQAGTFDAELRNQNLQKGRGADGTEFELYVIYRPRAGAPTRATESKDLASVEQSPRSANGGPK
jgi:Tfp pilus assembly protein PilN